MSKKKSRTTSGSAPAATAIVPQQAVTGVTTQSPAHVTENRPSMPKAKQQESFLQTPLGRFCHRVFRVFASLQLAICLLTIFTLSLIQATILESHHNAEIAKQLIYGAWWFTLLLFCLGANIICAALKKMDPKILAEGRWPWKKYQTGFLVTHLGLITLVFGGLLTALGGEEGQIQVIDMPDSKLSKDDLVRLGGRIQQTSSTLLSGDEKRLVITKVKLPQGVDPDEVPAVTELPKEWRDKFEGKQWDWDVNPGHLPWFDEEGYQSNLTWGMKVLRNFAAPMRGSSRHLDGGGTMRLTNYYPWAEQQSYANAARAGSHSTFPAVQLEVQSKLFPTVAEIWVAGMPSRLLPNMKQLSISMHNHLSRFSHDQSQLLVGQDTVQFDLLTASYPEQVAEFLRRPSVSEVGEKGELTLYVGPDRRPFRVRIEEAMKGKAIEIPDAGMTFKLTKIENLLDNLEIDKEHEKEVREWLKKRAGDIGSYPLVKFELTRRDGKSSEYQSCARIPNLPSYAGEGTPVAEVVAFYHPADGLWDRKSLLGAVHLLIGPNGKTYFRAFGQSGELSDAGVEIDLADPKTSEGLPWREAARTSFRPLVFYPAAMRPQQEHQRTFKPRNIERIGAALPSGYASVLRGVLNADGEEHEFSVGLNHGAARVFTSKRDLYQIRFINTAKTLPFEVTLHRARAPRDPGSTRFAGYESNITVKAKEGSDKPVDHKLYMNHTLDYGGYRFFQANFQETEIVYDDPKLDARRKANISGIQLARDPGRYFKYSGTIIVVLGIFIMFYMKAYFFKPRARSATA